MTLEELKNQLEAANKSELFETIADLVNAEKEKGISEKQKANREAQNLRKFKIAMEKLGYDESVDLEEFVSSVGNKKTGDSLTLKLLNDKLKQMESQLEAERSKAKHSKINSELTRALNDKLYGSQYVIKALIADGKVDLADDQVVFKDGDTVLDFDAGIKKVLDSNKDILKTTQNPGTGSKPSSGVPTNIQAILQSGDQKAIDANLATIAQEMGLKI